MAKPFSWAELSELGRSADAEERLIRQIGPFELVKNERLCSADGWFFVHRARIARPAVSRCVSGAEVPPPSDRVSFAAWRRSELPAEIPTYVTMAPAWCCAAFTKGAREARVEFRSMFAALGVSHYWLLDVEARVLEALELDAGRWCEIGAFGDGDRVRLAPFEAREIDVSALFEPLQDGA